MKLGGIIQRKAFGMADDAKKHVWRSLSAAIISRAAGQLSRHADRLSELSINVQNALGIQSLAQSAEPDALDNDMDSEASEAVASSDGQDDGLNALATMEWDSVDPAVDMDEDGRGGVFAHDPYHLPGPPVADPLAADLITPSQQEAVAWLRRRLRQR